MRAPKTKFGKWMDNFWYHNKWEAIIIVCIIVVASVIIPQFVVKTDYEISVLFTGPAFINADQDASVESAFRQIMSDYDRDGEKNVQLVGMTAFTSSQAKELVNSGKYSMSILAPYLENNITESFSTQVFAGENSICLLDRYWYDMVKSSDGFVPLSEVIGYHPDYAIDDFGVYLKDTEFGQYFSAFDILPEDTILCIRRMSTAAAFLGKSKTEASYNYSKQLFTSIFSFTFPEGYVPSEIGSYGTSAESSEDTESNANGNSPDESSWMANQTVNP